MDAERSTLGGGTNDGVSGSSGPTRAAHGASAQDEWARVGKLWAELRQWLRYRDDWTVQIDPWGIYGCVTATATHRSGSPERKYSEHGENLEVRLINVLAWLKGQPE